MNRAHGGTAPASSPTPILRPASPCQAPSELRDPRRPCALPAITKAGFTSVQAASSTSQEATTLSARSRPRSRGKRHQAGPLRAPGAPEPGDRSARPRAAGGPDDVCAAAAAASPHAPPAPPVRDSRDSTGGWPGPCGNLPVPGHASLLPAPRIPPRGHPASHPAAHPCARLEAGSPPSRHCEWVSPRQLPLRLRWNPPERRGREPWPLPQVIASSCGQSAPSLTSRQPSARPPAGVGGQRERRAGMFTNKIGE